MSVQNNALAAMLEQYETNNKPKYEKRTDKVFDLKNYFTTYLPKGTVSLTKTIRILPTADGSSPFVEMYAHKIKIDGESKTFPCLKYTKNEPCPFCEAREALLATGSETDKELAKTYNTRLMYIVKVIDRDDEEHGVKFWRFNHNYKKEGNLDKIQAVIRAIKKDITNPEIGRDLSLTINKNDDITVVSGVASLDPSPLSEDPKQAAEWMADDRTWRSVYAEKNYDYLLIVVKGGVPVWDKTANCFVDKNSTAAVKTETNALDTELTMGVENVKSNIIASTTETITSSVESTVEDEVDDDLPF